MVEYYPDQNRIFLVRLFEKIKNEENLSADEKIHQIISQYINKVESISFDTPLSYPKCVTCKLKCPGFDNCDQTEIEWLRNHYKELNKKRKPKKTFTPYTERCVEAYLGHKLEEKFEIHHALGSNLAPLTARAIFLKRRLKAKLLEVMPQLTVWRLGQKLRVAASHLKYHKHAIGGDESRKVFLRELSERMSVFIYQQDLKSMVENNHAFEAFMCAFTGYLSFQGQTEKRPAQFPKAEAWVEFPL